MADSYINSVDQRDENEVAVNPFLAVNDPSRISLKEREDAELIRATQAIARTHLTPEVPHPQDKVHPARFRALAAGMNSEGGNVAHPLSPVVADLETLRTELETVAAEARSSTDAAPLNFPNLALEAVLAGLAKEMQTNDRLNGHVKEAEKHQKDIDLILDLKAKLNALKDDVTEMPEEIKALVNQLKERQIDLWKSEDFALSKDKISGLKSSSDSYMERARSQLHTLFTIKIQNLIQSIGAILDSVKEIVRNNSRLNSAIAQRSVRQ